MNREQTMDMITSRRGFVFIHQFHCHEVVQFRDSTARGKITRLLRHSNKKYASNSSNDGDKAVSVKHDSIG